MNSQTSVAPLKVLIYNKDPADRWLIGNYLRQGTDREVVTQETDQMSEAKVAADRCGLDLIIVDLDMPDQSGYWLEKIMAGFRSRLLSGPRKTPRAGATCR